MGRGSARRLKRRAGDAPPHSRTCPFPAGSGGELSPPAGRSRRGSAPPGPHQGLGDHRVRTLTLIGASSRFS